jgi:acyl dehydratase
VNQSGERYLADFAIGQRFSSGRLPTETGLNPAGGYIGAGAEGFRWPRPVRPGDELHVECEVVAVRPSASRPERGLIKVQMNTLNQDDEAVLTYVANLVVPRRPDV